MKELLKEIKNKNFRNLYLLYGNEHYLTELYERKLRNAVMDKTDGDMGLGDFSLMNLDIFDGKNITASQVIDAVSTLPFMQDKRLVIARDTGLFAVGRKDETDKLAVAISDLPPSTVLIFNEPLVDKRNKLYKKVTEFGRAIEFKTPSEKELSDWVIRTFKKENKKISIKNALFLVKTLNPDMRHIMNECQKLIAYKDDDTEILQSDIEFVCCKTLETKIFDMIGAVCNKKTDVALNILANLLIMKESPIMILSMMARQFRLILLSKFMAEHGSSTSEIIAETGQRNFVISECLKQAKNFTIVELHQALKDCLEADLGIKTGKISDKLAVEILLIKYSMSSRKSM